MQAYHARRRVPGISRVLSSKRKIVEGADGSRVTVYCCEMDMLRILLKQCGSLMTTTGMPGIQYKPKFSMGTKLLKFRESRVGWGQPLSLVIISNYLR